MSGNYYLDILENGQLVRRVPVETFEEGREMGNDFFEEHTWRGDEAKKPEPDYEVCETDTHYILFRKDTKVVLSKNNLAEDVKESKRVIDECCERHGVIFKRNHRKQKIINRFIADKSASFA